VMRGIMVPPGAATVELRFVPFMVSWYGFGVFAVGFLMAALGWWVLRRWPRPIYRRPTRALAVSSLLEPPVDREPAPRAPISAGRAAGPD